MVFDQDLEQLDDSALTHLLHDWWGLDIDAHVDELYDMTFMFPSDRVRHAEYLLSDECIHGSGIPVAGLCTTVREHERLAIMYRQSDAFIDRALRLLCPDCTKEMLCESHEDDQ